MVKVTLQLLDGKLCLSAELAADRLQVVPLLYPTTVTIVNFLTGDFLQSIASEVKTRIARIAVQNLIGVIVEAAEADLAICLKKLLGRGIFAFDRFHVALAIYKLL